MYEKSAFYEVFINEFNIIVVCTGIYNHYSKHDEEKWPFDRINKCLSYFAK